MLVEMLLSKFCSVERGNLQNSLEEFSFNGNTFIGDLKSQLRQILLPTDNSLGPLRDNCCLDEGPMQNQTPQTLEVRRMFERSYDLGRDTRWFCRVISLSLSLLVEDLQTQLLRTRKSVEQTSKEEIYDRAGNINTPNTIFDPNYLLEGLIVMGGTTDIKVDRLRTVQENLDSHSLGFFSTSNNTATSTSVANNNAMYGPFNCDGKHVSPVGWNSIRLQALLDLPGSQVAILLAAKRVLSRNAQKQDSSIMTPFTYDRIEMEYESYKASGLDRYGGHVLYRSFCQLMETDLFRPARDHAGGCPLQYYYRGDSNPLGVDPMALRRLPLHMNVDLCKELDVALRNKMLDCTTALRDWGLKEQ